VRLVLKHMDEFVANNLALFLRVLVSRVSLDGLKRIDGRETYLNASESIEETIACVDDGQVDSESL